MKRFLLLILCLCFALSLASCKKRTDASGTFELYSQNEETYVLRYVAKELKFGNFYVVIENECFKEFYTTYDSNVYKLEDYYLRVGGNTQALKLVEEETGEQHFYPVDKNGEVMTFKLIKEVSEEGYETPNTFSLKMYVCYEDVNTDHTTTTTNADNFTTNAEGDETTTEAPSEGTTTAVDTTTTLVADSSITITTKPEDLVVFIRKENLNTSAKEE